MELPVLISLCAAAGGSKLAFQDVLVQHCFVILFKLDYFALAALLKTHFAHGLLNWCPAAHGASVLLYPHQQFSPFSFE
jgi:hypothetical protein